MFLDESIEVLSAEGEEEGGPDIQCVPQNCHLGYSYSNRLSRKQFRDMYCFTIDKVYKSIHSYAYVEIERFLAKVCCA